MNIVGVVFLYKPEIEKVISNISKYIDGLSKLIIWDNTPEEKEADIRRCFTNTSFYNKLVFMGNSGNIGLARPINEAIRITINEKYDALLTMDQDTIWTNFNYYISKIEEFGINNRIFTPCINKEFSSSSEDLIKRKEPLINSGTIYSIEALKSVGFMNEIFFTEGMDNEYYYRALYKGIDVFLVAKAVILQNVEDVHFYNFPIKIVTCRFSPQRLYGITFGIRYIMREFPYDKNIQNYYKWWIRHHYGIKLLFKILFFESNKLEKLYMYFKGIIDANRATIKIIK